MMIWVEAYWGLFVSVLLVLLLFAPVATFLRLGWAIRRNEVLGILTPKAIGRYFAIFHQYKECEEQRLQKEFEEFYDQRFGRERFIIPAALLLALSAILVVGVVETTRVWLGAPLRLPVELPPIAVAAIAGAYMWVAWELISRNRRRDLAPSDLLRCSLRFVIAVPLGYAVGASFNPALGKPIAFLLGAFPTATLFSIMRRIAVRTMKFSDGKDRVVRELTKLHGTNEAVAERFADADVETILQLAYSDPVELTIRTNLGFSYVLDCASQALAWVYFEDGMTHARRRGLKGAYEMSVRIDELEGTVEGDESEAEQVINSLASALNLDVPTLKSVLHEISEDPYTRFLRDAWCYEPD